MKSKIKELALEVVCASGVVALLMYGLMFCTNV